jgi:hypothetical protein
MRRLILAGVFVLAALSASPAQADFDYSSPQTLAVSGMTRAASCPTTAFCAVGDAGGDVFTSTNPTAGGQAIWAQNTINVNRRINAVSCPSTALCAAVDSDGNVITSIDPAAGATATWTVKSIDPGFSVTGVSCPTTALCVAVDDSGRPFYSTNPTAGASATWTKVNGVPFGGAPSIDCPTTSLCVAVDEFGNVATSTNPIGDASAWNVADIDGTTGMFGVDCNASLCIAGDQDGKVLASNNPTASSSWHASDLDSSTTTNSVFGVSCPSSTLCAAADNGGKIWTTTVPLANPAVWTGTQTDAFRFTGLVCPSIALCVAPGLGNGGQGVVVIATPAKPAVLTFFANNVTASSATLHGSVNPKGFNVTSCKFDVGPSAGSYPTSVNCAQTVGSGSGAVPVSADLNGLPQNTTVHFRLEATNANGTNMGIDQSFTTLTSFTEVKNTQRPQISGTPQTGSQLACTNGTWTNTDNQSTYSITWERGVRAATADNDPSWHAIDGASGSTYVVQQADEGSRVRCHVVATSQGISGEASSTSLRTDSAVPVNTAAPTITGTPIQGSELTCHPGSWSGSPDFTYQWTRSGIGPIPGATGPKYTLRPSRADDADHVTDPNGDGNHIIGCQVIGTNDLGSSAPAQVFGPLAVDGPPYPFERPHITVDRDDPSDDNPVKQTFDCGTGRWWDGYGTFGVDPYKYAWQWYRNGAEIQDATQSRYRPTSADYGREITCVVTNGNPSGRRAGPADNPILVALPKGNTDTEIYREGPRNQVDPTNLMAISHDYLNAVNDVVLGRLKDGIASATSDCKDKIKANGWPKKFTGFPLQIPDEEVRCLILVYQPEQVQPYLDGGVRYLAGGACSPYDRPLDHIPLCPSLGIQVAPIDPLRPPAQDQELIGRLAAVSPKEILWDLDGNGTTDAVCPGSAPVLRTIYEWNRAWHPRAVILDQNDQPAHFGDLSWDTADGTPRTTVDGKLRAAQVKVCAVSFDPPPDKKLPCVTSGDIGRIHISNANLCPIDERAINPKDFSQLLPDDAQGNDIQGYLQAVSDARLAGEGTATKPKLRAPGIATRWVRWHDAPTGRGGTGVRTRDGALLTRFQIRDVASALDNTGAALSARNSPDHYAAPARNAAFNDTARRFTSAYEATNDGFAYNQIYVARSGDGTGTGSVDVNGVTMQALGDTATLLLPSDIGSALPKVKDMTLVGRDASSYLGPHTQNEGIPLAIGGELKTRLSDTAASSGQQLLRETNLDQMVQQAKDRGTAEGNKLADELRKALDVEPFKLFGDSKVTVEKDGTATLHARAELPGLTGSSSSDKLGADVTIHADLQGRIKLDGIHLHAGKALLGGMTLSNVDVNYNRTTDVAVSGKILFPQLGNQGVDIKRFALSPTGAFQELNLDYLAGAGGGIPLGQGVFLTTLGADLNVAQDIFSAHVVVSAGASTGAGCPSLGADGRMTISLAQPFYVDANVDLLLTCIKLGNIHFRVDQTGAIQVDGNWGLTAGPIHFSAGVGGKFHYPDWEVWADGEGGIDPLLSGEVHAVLSNVGLAACGAVNIEVSGVSDVLGAIGLPHRIHVAAGASVDFINGRPPLNQLEIINNLSIFTGCDIGRYYSLGHGKVAVRGAAAGSSGFTVPAKAGPSLFSIEGAGAAPHVKLHSPSGQVLDFTDATGHTGKRLPGDAGWGTVIESEDRTVVIIPQPKAGRWTAEVAPGSPAVSRVRRAPILTPAVLKAHVSGHGIHRVLTYLIPKLGGQTVRFSESAPGGLKILKTIEVGGKGHFAYTVGDAIGTKRVVEADFFQNKHPRKRVIIARYSAKSPPVGKARHLVVRRHGTHAVLTWRKAALGATYLVRVDYGSGTRIVLIPKPGVRRVTVPNVRRGEGLRIRVFASSAAGRRGPAATATLKGSMRVGAVKKAPRYKPPKKHKKHKKHKKK